jgi:dTDP-L-rhamnose 4-epimerase
MGQGGGLNRRALVTGGAGLIGSHIVDLLMRHGWSVRILDNLEPLTHPHGRPPWVHEAAEFIHGDIRDATVVETALQGIDVVFHQAAYGGFMPEMAKYITVNSAGTAQMLELIRDRRLPVKKLILASSQVVYSEGMARCGVHGVVCPSVRSVHQLRAGDFTVHCPRCGGPTTSIPTAEDAPIGGETVYAISKVSQERLALTWGRQTGIPTVALRYSCTYGPRQSPFNPYTGVIAIFCVRLLNQQPPILYEDGAQTRDFSYVEDVAAANLLAATTTALDGQAVNVGSGRAVSIRDLAGIIGDVLGVHVEPVARGEFRPGEIRHLTADTRRIATAGYAARTDLRTGIQNYVEWIRAQADILDYFSAIEPILRAKGIVHHVAAG